MENTLDAWMEQLLLLVPTIASALAVFAAFCIAGRLMEKASDAFFKRTSVNRTAIQIFRGASKFTILALGAITALGTLGVDVSALVAGLGLTGFALGFALRDALSSLLAGLLILVYQPFEPGERIEVSGKEGVVGIINLRYTVLEAENGVFLVPNSTLLNNIISVRQLKKSSEER